MKLFEELNLNEELLGQIKRQGFTQPTKIQELSIPPILKGKDVIGESATGSGKTLAFGCGIIEKTVPKKGIQALVLSPTRELAEQVRHDLELLVKNKSLRITSIYGGVSINPQIEDLKRSEVVVATPGRLLDHLQRGTIELSNIKVLILDEADRMLDMGFIEDVEKIIRKTPKNRQTLFFSATIMPTIKKLADKHMNNPVKVSAEKMVDPKKLTQVYYDVTKNLKLSLLIHLLNKEESELIMIFCNTRKTADFVVKNLKHQGIKAVAIHGGYTQNKRTKTLEIFNDEKTNILACTDVASRGLHINNVSHVYNYDLPNDSNDYVHRIGRTARAGEEGKVINLLSEQDHENFSRIKNEYRDYNIKKEKRPYLPEIKPVGVDDLRRRNHRGFKGKRRKFNRN